MRRWLSWRVISAVQPNEIYGWRKQLLDDPAAVFEAANRSGVEAKAGENTKRWVPRRKAAVVAAVRSGKSTLEEACRCYHLSEEEFLSWQHAFEAHGLPGLRATRVQQYRVTLVRLEAPGRVAVRNPRSRRREA